MAWTAEQKKEHSLRMKRIWSARKKPPGGAASGRPAMSAGRPMRAGSAKGSLRCGICGRTFALAAHLGRHMGAAHPSGASVGASVVAKPANGRRVGRRKPGRRPQTPTRDFANMNIADLVGMRRRIDGELADRVVRGDV